MSHYQISLLRLLEERNAMTDSKTDSLATLIPSGEKILGAKWILMRIETLHGMMKEVEKILGTGACLVWHTAGKGAGKSLASLIKKEFETYNLRGISELLTEFYARCGWGRSEITSWREEGEIVLRVWDNAFAKKGSSKTPSCFFLKGFIQGILGELTGKCVEIEETKCISKGDEYCEFQIRLR